MNNEVVYNIIARHYNAKPKNIVRYFSQQTADLIQTVQGNRLIYFDPSINQSLQNSSASYTDSPKDQFFFGTYRCSFFFLAAPVANVRFAFVVFDVTEINLGAASLLYGAQFRVNYDSAGILGPVWPGFFQYAQYFNNENNGNVNDTLFNKAFVQLVVGPGGSAQVRATFYFDGFLINFK